MFEGCGYDFTIWGNEKMILLLRWVENMILLFWVRRDGSIVGKKYIMGG